MSKIKYMSFTLEMSRPVDKDRDSLVPGGYAAEMKDGSDIEFDFLDFYGNVQDDPTKVTFEHCWLDTDTYPGSEVLTVPYLEKEFVRFEEFFIHVEALPGDAEIKPVRVISCTMEDAEGNTFHVPDDAISICTD